MHTAHIVIDLGFGDCGKGVTVAKLVEQTDAKLVVRFNGGAQAAHNVVVGTVHHCFNQFGSGTLQGCNTYLSQKHLFNPVALYNEAMALATKMDVPVEKLLNRVYVNQGCLITTSYHIFLNRVKHLVTTGVLGTCGMGIGTTIEYPVLKVLDLYKDKFIPILKNFRETVLSLVNVHDARVEKIAKSLNINLNINEPCDELESSIIVFKKVYDNIPIVLDDTLVANTLKTSDVIFEGAQGVLLDEAYGLGPNTTWSDCTPRNARYILNYLEVPHKILTWGCLKPFTTRHGAGPFPSYDSRMVPSHYDPYNVTNDYQGDFRVGSFDLDLHMYAANVIGGVDALAVHGLDLDKSFKISSRGISETRSISKLMNIKPTKSITVANTKFCELIGKKFDAPVRIKGYSPDIHGKIYTPE